MNQAAMISLWREYVNEKNTTSVPDATVIFYLDGGQEATNRRLGWYRKTSTNGITLVNDTQEYSAFADQVRIVWVEHAGVVLRPGNLHTWENDGVHWRSVSAGIPREWAVDGDKIVFYPKPNAEAVAAAANPVVRYVATPPTLPSGGPAELGSQDHRLIVYHAVREWSSCHPDSALAIQRAERFDKLYESEIKAAEAYYAQRG